MNANSEIRNLVTVWSLRALSRSQSFKQHKRRRPVDEDLLLMVGLQHLADRAVTRAELMSEVSTRLQKVERTSHSRKGRFFRNIAELGEMVGLSECEQEILTFSLLLQEEPALRETVESIGNVGLRECFTELSAILDRKPLHIEKALHPRGPLASSGLLQIEKQSTFSIPDRLEPLEGLANAIRESALDRGLSTYFYQSPKPGLLLEDFEHLNKDLDTLLPYLKKAVSKKTGGCNVLLYGPPGTGKTELARTLAHALSFRLYEVSTEDEDGDPSDGHCRLRSYLLCQRLFSHQNNILILFDEVEDVFPSKGFNPLFPARRSGEHKGWTNRLLEGNAVPAIWITNTIDYIDPAFIRRFDIVLEIPVPPQSVRRRIIEKVLRGLPVGEDWIKTAADHQRLVPAHIERAVKVAKLVGVRDRRTSEVILRQIIASAHKAMGFPRQAASRSHMGRYYGIEFINSDLNLPRLIQALKKRQAGRICLYGPPGSGKTAFVHYAGKDLGKPLIIKRASDLLSCYVGETEKAIAAMFDEAREENAILLLDEADSFLLNRSRADHSWEMSQVNELLIQMEAFDGIFFCATNLMDVLDTAVFRRFDVKARFDFLSPDQAMSLFKAALRDAGASMPADIDRTPADLGQLRELTPGDFATALKKIELSGESVNGENLLEGLRRECAVKPKASKPLGF